MSPTNPTEQPRFSPESFRVAVLDAMDRAPNLPPRPPPRAAGVVLMTRLPTPAPFVEIDLADPAFASLVQPGLFEDGAGI